MKAKDHKYITRKSIEIFTRYDSGNFAAFLKKYENDVVTGSIEADSSPIYPRITNWHFFKENEYLVPKTVYYAQIIPLPVTPTSEVILQYRLDEIEDINIENVPQKYGDRVGRVLHHVQDMSTPSHVVPVYHGPILKDSFEDYAHDHAKQELSNLEIDKAEFNALVNECTEDIPAVYSNAATDTLEYLYNDPASRFTLMRNQEEIEAGWDMFWLRNGDDPAQCAVKPFEDIPGFGCFGPLGTSFGSITIPVNNYIFSINKEVYRKLLTWVLKKQVRDSLKVLIVFNHR